MATVGLVASILLGLVFILSGATKVAAGAAWPEQARDLGAPSFVVPVLPWFEIVLGAALVMQLAPVLAAATALVVLSGFTVLIARRLAQGQHSPCACFGEWSSRPLSPTHLVRNTAFMALAVLALVA